MRFRKVYLVILVLIVVGSLGWASPVTETDAALDSVTLRMNWKFTGPHAPFFLEDELGIYRAHGIDLQIMEGNGSGNTAQLVGNKTDTFGLADASSLIPLMAQGLPIKSVAMVTPASSLAIIVRSDSGIMSLGDLEGKTIAAVAGGAPSALWPALAAANNIDPDSVKVVFVDAAAKIPLVLEGTADGLFGSVGDQDLIMEAEGVPATAFRFDKNGVVLLNLGIFVHEDLIEDNPDLIRRFLRATREIIEAYYDDPEKAAAGLVAAKPELTMDIAMTSAAEFYARVNSPNCSGSELLYNCPEDWQITIDVLKNYRGLEDDISLDRAFTNEFLD